MLNLLNNVPLDVKERIAQLSKNDDILKGFLELVILFGEKGIIVKEKIESIGGKFENLGYGFGIITINSDKLEQIGGIEEIQYIELPKILYTSDLESNRASCVPDVWNLYGLTGKGVLVGFIDSGIDFTHPAFKDADGNTRIDYICDLSEGGKIWSKNEINQALKSPNPYEIVNERDLSGHGTHVAGIACAGGNIDRKYYGVAYESSIAMVKMTPEGKVNYARSTQLMRGIKFLLDKSYEIKKTLAINLSFSTNDGAHNGSSLLEQYIDTICNLERISFVVASGNEGDRAHHVGGVLEASQNISINIAEDERVIVLQFYKDFLDDISVEIKSPAGVVSQNLFIKEGYYEGAIGDDRYFIYNSGPKPFDINGEIVITLSSQKEFILGGVWQITINSLSKTRGKYDIWMPISEGLNPNTKFLKPNPFNTLGIPATVQGVISVGSYNYRLNSISSFSGRGEIGGDKPDLAAPGEGILSSIPMGEFDSLSGTSMAAPHVVGAAALLMQWGIIQGNDVYMYGDRLKYFLLKGAIRDKNDVEYPGPTWGYGKLCVKGGVDLAKGIGVVRQQVNKKEYIVEYDGDIMAAFKNIDFAYPLILDERYAVVYIDEDKAEDFFSKTKEIIYVEDLTHYILNQVSPLDSANILKFHTSSFLNLRGQGVLVGIVDTGIDYLNKEFMYENDTTRIIDIWDQTLPGDSFPKDFGFGREYVSEEINNAIAAKSKGEDPYAIVNSKDEIGHGTNMAGIIGGRGINPQLVGAAPDCQFAVVKLKPDRIILPENAIEGKGIPVYSSINIILAIKHLYNLARKLNIPTVIYIPLGTNEGAHDGSSIVERYIDEISKIRGIVVVTGCGNQGDQDIHTDGVLKQDEERIVEIKVDEMERELSFEIWCKKPDKVSIGIISPSGEVVDKIPAKIQEQEEIKLVYEGSTILVKYFIPEEITGDELIRVNIQNITSGIWRFKLIGDYIVSGRYDIWLPQRELLKNGTRFLAPSQYVTLTVPSTSNRIISCAYYNQNNNTVVAASGKGYTRDLRVKPDIAAGGVNAITTAVGGGVTTVSGSSVAAAVTAGASALLLEWGIVKGNDVTMYSTKLKTYLIRGARQRTGDVYPNREWGYGQLDLDKVFMSVRGFEREKNIDRGIIEYEMYKSKLVNEAEGNIYINIPKDVYELIDN
ncbi:S8 family peptidase [Clostridium sp. KNHs214]|uniref:S8 family peptidase n=1 Tax=Clostridium sp. KNHs214 TaxID=1540257 RepID=UPI00257034E1|nr:S8 family peptidase [Clostridium sp. KNHs214]